MKKKEKKKDDVKEMSINPENARKTAELLFEAFFWYDSKEGYDYWNKVHDKLWEIAEKGRRKVCPHCGQIIKKEEAGK